MDNTEACIYPDTSYKQTTHHEALKIFIVYLKQRFMHSTHVQSMADIDPNTYNGAQARVRIPRPSDEWIDE